MKRTVLILAMIAGSCLGAFAQNSPARTYTSKELGWTITIPAGWENISEETFKEYQAKGQEISKEAGKGTVDMSKMKKLAMFRKGRFNSFQSSVESLTGFTIEQIFRYNVKAIYEMLQSQGLSADTATGKETINGKEYWVLNTTISTPQAKNVAQQTMYYRQIGKQTFIAALLYNSEATKKELMDAFKNSTWNLPAGAQAKPEASKTITSKKIGWSINIPEGFENMPQEEVDAYASKGKKYVEAAGKVANDANQDNIAAFQKDAFNIFQASALPTTGPVDSIYKETTETLYATYKQLNIQQDTSTTRETVNGKEFIVLNMQLSTPDGKKLLQQKSYFTKLKNHVFMATIISNNATDEQLIFDAFKASVWE